jgi:hypothetical protein
MCVEKAFLGELLPSQFGVVLLALTALHDKPGRIGDADAPEATERRSSALSSGLGSQPDLQGSDLPRRPLPSHMTVNVGVPRWLSVIEVVTL